MLYYNDIKTISHTIVKKEESDMEKTIKKEIEEKVITNNNGFKMLVMIIAGYIIATLCFAASYYLASSPTDNILIALGIILVIVLSIMCNGFHILNPNEALVLTLFGKYYGTIKQEGFYYMEGNKSHQSYFKCRKLPYLSFHPV